MKCCPHVNKKRQFKVQNESKKNPKCMIYRQKALAVQLLRDVVKNISILVLDSSSEPKIRYNDIGSDSTLEWGIFIQKNAIFTNIGISLTLVWSSFYPKNNSI